jgi:hypothetical protein
VLHNPIRLTPILPNRKELSGHARVRLWPVFTVSGSGEARQLRPGTSDLDLLGNLNGIVDFDAKISNRALDLRVAQQELDGTPVAGSSVDQRALVRRSECVPNLSGSRPMLAIHWLTRRAY